MVEQGMAGPDHELMLRRAMLEDVDDIVALLQANEASRGGSLDMDFRGTFALDGVEYVVLSYRS